MMNWIKKMFVFRNGGCDWFATMFTCAAIVACMFLLFATCEKKEPEPGRTQVGSHTIVNVKSVLELEARELEKGK